LAVRYRFTPPERGAYIIVVSIRWKAAVDPSPMATSSTWGRGSTSGFGMETSNTRSALLSSNPVMEGPVEEATNSAAVRSRSRLARAVRLTDFFQSLARGPLPFLECWSYAQIGAKR